MPSRRFAVVQNGKVRPIDDFSANGINRALAAIETIDPDDLDRIAANVRAHLAAFCGDADDAASLGGSARHPDHEGTMLLCRLWDLAKAYRQIARSPEHAGFAVVA